MNKFFLRVLNKFNLLHKVNVVGKIILNNKQFKIPVLGKTGFLNMWMTEPWMIKLLEIVVPLSPGIFVDVGVNSGQTLLKLKSVSGQTEYIGFEPNPSCIFYVNELVRINGFKNVSLLPVGISTETQLGKLFFFDESAMDSSASIVADFRPGQKIEKAEYIPVFSIVAIKQKMDIGKIGIIKIDVEGGELEVLSDLETDIIANQPILLIEILPVYKEDNIKRLQRQNGIEALFLKWDYTVYRVIKQHEQLMDIVEITGIGIHTDLNCCEYAVVPRRLKEDFQKSISGNLAKV